MRRYSKTAAYLASAYEEYDLWMLVPRYTDPLRGRETVSRTLKTIALCFLAGGIAGTLTVLLGCHTGYLLWSGIAIIVFTVTLSVSLAVARKFAWISVDPSRKQLVIALTLMGAIYPISLLTILLTALWQLYVTIGRDSVAFETFSYATVLRAPVSQIFDLERSIMLDGLTLAVILGAILLTGSLRVVTRKWDIKVLILMFSAIVATPFLNHIIALAFTQEGREAVGWIFSRVGFSRVMIGFSAPLSILKPMYPEPTLFCYNDALLQIFPLGNAFIAALSGYWIRRANGHDQRAGVEKRW